MTRKFFTGIPTFGGFASLLQANRVRLFYGEAWVAA
jgi:hypothetical protein